MKHYECRAERAKWSPPEEHCELCGEAGTLVWDHDHRTGKGRGWIHQTCNSLLGFAKDSPALCRAAAAYLERPAQTAEARYAAWALGKSELAQVALLLEHRERNAADHAIAEEMAAREALERISEREDVQTSGSTREVSEELDTYYDRDDRELASRVYRVRGWDTRLDEEYD